MTKKHLIYVIPAMILGGALLAGATVVGAQSAEGNYPSIVQKLADRFNLNLEDVKSVFAENRQEVQLQMEENFQNALDEMVADGKITQEQEEAILEKREEMQGLKEELKDLEPEERQAKMHELRDEVKQWLEENNLNPGLIMGLKKGFGSRGMGMGMGIGHDCPFQNEAAEE